MTAPRKTPRRRNATSPHRRPEAITWPDSTWRWAEDGALVLTLPVPGSANRLSRTGKGRMGRTQIYKPRAEREYQAAAGWAMASCPKIAGDVEVAVIWYRAKRQGDVDNRLKPLLDALKDVAFGDDAAVARLSIERIDSPDVRPCMVVAIRRVA
jgi:Holliday junction resolvase RusA-like endonuclease